MRRGAVVLAGLLLLGACTAGDDTDDAAGSLGAEPSVVGLYLSELAASEVLESFPDDRAAVEYAHRSRCLVGVPSPVAAEIAQSVVPLVDALLSEAVASAVAMEQDAAVDEDLRTTTDRAGAELLVALDGYVAPSEVLANSIETYRTRSDDLPTVRSAVDGRQMSVLNAVRQLNDTARAARDILTTLAREVGDPAMAQRLGELVDFVGGVVALSAGDAVVSAVIVRGAWEVDTVPPTGQPSSSAELAEVAEIQWAYERADQQVQRWSDSAEADTRSLWRSAISAEAVREADGFAAEALVASETASAVDVPLDAWLAARGVRATVYADTMAAEAQALPEAADFSLGVEVDQAVRDACEAVDDRILDVDPATVE